MARFSNDSGSVITVADLGQTVGPYEEFDWPGYDPDAHGPVSGCTQVEDGPAATGKPRRRRKPDSGTDNDPDNPAVKASADSGSAQVTGTVPPDNGTDNGTPDESGEEPQS